jgi:hypothetical protein
MPGGARNSGVGKIAQIQRFCGGFVNLGDLEGVRAGSNIGSSEGSPARVLEFSIFCAD